MRAEASNPVTLVLKAAAGGDREAATMLLPLVFVRKPIQSGWIGKGRRGLAVHPGYPGP